MDQPTSIFDRIFGQPRPIWVVLIVSISLLLLPIAFVYLDGALDEFFNQGRWRVFLLPPTIIIYIWLVSPLMVRMGTNVIESIRPLVQRLEQGLDPGNLSGEIIALEVYEKRLLAARTWPYNTSMLRTLFFSILIPLGSILARLAIDIMLP